MSIHLPQTLNEALHMLQVVPHAQILAGGTDFMVEVNFNKHGVHDVIALRHVDELKKWSHDTVAGVVTIGAAVPYADMEHGELAQLFPALAEAARTVGSPQIRAAGTLGGNLGTCSPAGDALPVLFALNAVINVASTHATRSIPVADFMRGPKRNDLAQDELIVSVTIKTVAGWQGYAKVGTRNAMVISVASASLVLDHVNNSSRIALGSVGPTIIRCIQAEQWLQGVYDFTSHQALDDSIATEFGQRVSQESRPIDDHRSTALYRRHAVGVLAKRLLQRGSAQ
ncbi:MAG: xanthine dehydrogenase family protein subunit M [Ilumatobacteraceae bacterium]|nr:xanthine dehydrogenase family protein subunit M [Ilumatobacteraceae bacterium]